MTLTQDERRDLWRDLQRLRRALLNRRARRTRRDRRTSLLMRVHWWCMAMGSRFDRPPGYSLRSLVFDWIGGRAANLARKIER